MTKAVAGGQMPVSTRRELVEAFEKGVTPKADQGLGGEIEMPPFYQVNHAPVPHQPLPGQTGPALSHLFNKLAAEKNWQLETEGGKIIGLSRKGAAVSVEPGAQVEINGEAHKTVHDFATESAALMREVVDAGQDLGIGFLATGYHPTYAGKDLPFVHKSRNDTLRTFAEQRNNMDFVNYLCCTSGMQLNVTYDSEGAWVKMLRVALSLQPVAEAICANSPFKDGAPAYGFQSYRSRKIHNALGGRIGSMLSVAFEPGFGFERYTDYMLDTMPMIGLYKGNVFVDAQGGMFKDLMQGKLAAVPGQQATLGDWGDYLNTFYPEVRVKLTMLELRGTDTGPLPLYNALPAYWGGILYDPQALDAAYDMVKDWTDAQRNYLRASTPATGLQTPFLQGNVQDIAKQSLQIAEMGLKNRNFRDAQGNDETVHLAPFNEIANSGRNLAIRLTDRYYNAWNGDIGHIFDDMSFGASSTILTPAASKIILPGKKGFGP